jgi:hypothetical protein
VVVSVSTQVEISGRLTAQADGAYDGRSGERCRARTFNFGGHAAGKHVRDVRRF